MANVTEGARRNNHTPQDACALATQGVLLGRTKMPAEIIGEIEALGESREWIDAGCQSAIRHLKKVGCEPAPKMELEV